MHGEDKDLHRQESILIEQFVTNRKTTSLIFLEDVKGRGWEALRKSIFFVSKSPFCSVTRTEEVEAKVKNKAGLVGWSGDRSYARVVDKKGKALTRMMGVREMISINPFSAFKDVFFVDSAKRAEWLQAQGKLVLRGVVFRLQKWSPRENTMVLGKFRRGWIELRPHSIYGMKTSYDSL
ncbi:hypothetical protein AAG906_013800 [Vitis piasezkii]